jgi:hypothetical protein
MKDERHTFTLRLPTDRINALKRIKSITGQSITSQLIETAMMREVEFEKRLTTQQKVHNRVMRAV